MAGQTWQLQSDGGYFANPRLSKKLRHASQPLVRARQFTRIEPGFGKNMSDSLDFDKVSNVNTAGGAISETAKIPESKVSVKKGTLVVTEYGLKIPYTGKLEALSEYNPYNPFQKALKDDMAKALDIATMTQFKATEIKYAPTGPTTGTWATNGTPGTATSQMSVFHLKEIVDGMKRGNFGGTAGRPVPFYEDGCYICLASVTALRSIKDDPEWEEWHKYTSPEDRYTNEMGKYYGVRFVETNHENALSASIGANSIGEALIFGEDPVIEGVVLPEEIRAGFDPAEMGRAKWLSWYFMGGFKIVWNFASDSEQRIVHITSA